MQRRVVVATVVMVAAVTALTSVGLASGGPVPASRAAAVLHVVEHATTDTVVNSGGPGDRTGNLLTFHNALFDATNHRRVGSDLGHCVRIVPGRSWDCIWTAFLRDGEITVYGPYFDTHDSTLAITGGTGLYSRARGSMRLHARSGGTEYDFIYRLT